MLIAYLDMYIAVFNVEKSRKIDAGKDLGLWNASGILPDVFAPSIGSFIIDIAASYGQTALGYRLVFTVATLILVVASMSILFVRER